jgi:hypothetical protein
MPISEKSSATNTRLVVKKLFARQLHEGFGAVVRRSIGRFEFRYFDPFLVLDEFSVSAPAGFPDHPHRGWFCYRYFKRSLHVKFAFTREKTNILNNKFQLS